MMINARDAFAKLPEEEQAAIKARAMKLAKLQDHFGMLSEARQEASGHGLAAYSSSKD
jgi:hypothetical protein